MKPRNKFLKNREIILPALSTKTKGRGVGYNKKKGRYFISYLDNGKRTEEYLNVDNMEDAVKERDRRYIELILAGAKRKGERVKTPKHNAGRFVESTSVDRYIHEKKVTVTRYVVILSRNNYVGTYNTKEEARKARDEAHKESILKPCAICGKQPEMILRKTEAAERWILEHKGCVNEVRIPKMGRSGSIKKWNAELYKRGTTT